MISDSLKKAQKKYDMENTVHVSLKFNKKTDQDIIEKLDQQENKQTYIKNLIRRDSGRQAVESDSPTA